jgi:hypothetical protein
VRLCLTLVALLGGCATAPSARENASTTSSGFFLQLSPASFGKAASFTQRLTVTTDLKSQTVDALLEVDATAIRIAFVSLGQTVGTLSWNGRDLQAQSTVPLPEALTAARVLTDIQLVWWPVDALKRGLPTAYTLDAGTSSRVLLKAGVPVATVRFEGTGSHRKASLTHHGQYRLEIDSTEEAL